MKFEILTRHHLKPLLDFELESKAWFESLIEPRANDFYSEQGVGEHIAEQINNMNLGTAYCGVLIQDNVIVARGNLKGIVDNKASVGYRVSKLFTSQGFASACLTELIKIAQHKFAIKMLYAQVLDNNPASQHVLEKQGFKVIGNKPNFITLNNQQLACSELNLKIVVNE